MDNGTEIYDLKKYATWVRRQNEQILTDAESRVALLCYFYPQYTLEDAANVVDGDMNLLLKTALRVRAEASLRQLAICAASTNAKSYKKLYKTLTEEIKRLKR